MGKGWRRGAAWRMLAAGAALLGCVAGWQGPAAAGSDNVVDPYAGDYMLLALPEGTIAAINYTAYRYGDEFIQNSNNLLGKFFFQPKDMHADVELATEIGRFAYLTSFLGHPLALEAAIPYVGVANDRLGTVPVTVNDGVRDAVLFFDYGLIVDPKNERFLDSTNNFFVPTGNYDKFKVLNVSTPDQFTYLSMLALNEGLAKYGIQSFWLDIYAQGAFHSDGDSPVAVAPGVQFNKLTQDNSYDLSAYLRYSLAPLPLPVAFVAIGIEKSWGGNQIASGGVLGSLYGPTSLGLDDYLKGHLQAQYAFTKDFFVAADLTHDFERVGGLREDFTAELRLTKLFFPAPAPLK